MREATHSGLVGFFRRSLLSISDQDSLQFPVGNWMQACVDNSEYPGARNIGK